MFWNILLTEQQKIFKRAILWVEVGLLTALVILTQIGMVASNPPYDIVQRQVIWPMALVIYLRQFAANSLITGFIVIVLSGAGMAQEYTWGTIHTLASRGILRWKLLLGKFAAMLLPTLLIVVIPMLFGGGLSGYYTYRIHGALDPSQVNFLQLGLSILVGAYALLPYAALAILLAVLGRSSVAAIGGGIGFLIGEMMIWQFLTPLGSVGASITRWFPMSLSMSLLKISQSIANTIPPGPGGRDLWDSLQLLAPGIAGGMVAVYLFFFLGVAGWAIMRQDLQ